MATQAAITANAPKIKGSRRRHRLQALGSLDECDKAREAGVA
jgi:hypothetical protein